MKLIKYCLLIPLVILSFAGCDTALEKNLSGKKVTLLAPVNNLITTDTLQTFYWELLDGATNYQIQVVTPRFDSIVRLIADTTTAKNIFLIDLDVNSYQWRVRAHNNSSSSEAGEIRNLKIQ
jgi:hypothetical protein